MTWFLVSGVSPVWEKPGAGTVIMSATAVVQSMRVDARVTPVRTTTWRPREVCKVKECGDVVVHGLSGDEREGSEDSKAGAA